MKMCGRQHKKSLIFLFIFLTLISFHFTVNSYSTWAQVCVASRSFLCSSTYFVSLYACEVCFEIAP